MATLEIDDLEDVKADVSAVSANNGHRTDMLRSIGIDLSEQVDWPRESSAVCGGSAAGCARAADAEASQTILYLARIEVGHPCATLLRC